MKRYRLLRGLLSLMLTAALVLFLLPPVGRAQEAVFRRITSLEELVTGQYLLVTEAGSALGVLQGEWITAVQPVISGGTVTDAKGAVWTLTVEDGVILTDSWGTAVSPLENGGNGITAGECRWSVSCSGGLFSFHSFSGEIPVTLAANRWQDSYFRAYRDGIIAEIPETYPCAFKLYALMETPPEPEEPREILTIADAVSAAPGTEITIQGTVILEVGTEWILQDSTGGIRLAFYAPETEPGDVLTVTWTQREDGSRTVTAWEKAGAAGLPAAGVTLEEILADQNTGALENTRVRIENVTVGENVLTAGDIAIPAVLSEGTPGGAAEVYAVVLREAGDYVLRVTDLRLNAPPDQEEQSVRWRSAAPEDILPTDTVAVTMEKDGQAWALGAAGGEVEATAVTLAEGCMFSASAEGLCWTLVREEGGLQLLDPGTRGVLYTEDADDGVRIGTSAEACWAVEEGCLRHTATGRYLSICGGSWQALPGREEEAAGQSVAFWVLEPEETVAAVAVSPDGGELRSGDPITLTCETEGASIYYAACWDGGSGSGYVLYTEPIVPAPGFGTLSIKAYAVKEGCADGPETICRFTEAVRTEYTAYFGQLHAHSDISDGTASPAALFAAAKAAGLDFFAVTDHSDSFDNAQSGAIAAVGGSISADWAAGKAAAAAAADDSFVGIFGYEMSWPERQMLGHISTFRTPGWQSWDQKDYSRASTALENYYKTLTTVPGSVSQFNHPGTDYGELEDFAHYTAEYDAVIDLLEVGTEKGLTACGYYIKALDALWHVAPTNNQDTHSAEISSARTVILAQTLTEESLFDAVKAHRVYATEDADLTVYFTLNGHIMGSILSGPLTPEIQVTLWDPTDEAAGRVEVIADGGAVVASQTLETSSGSLALSAPSGYSYYFLRITQPDGDVAVTAPVWVDCMEDMGIRSFTADTEVPTQNEALELTLEVFNEETEDLVLEKLEFSVDGQTVHTVDSPGTVAGESSLSYTFPYTHSGMGTTVFRATVTGTVKGRERTYEKTLTLRYRVPELVTRILVDGAHGGSTGELSHLTALASDANIGVTVFSDALPEDGSLLLIPAPSVPFEEAFLTAVAEFVGSGGSVVVCGQSDAMDTQLHASAELNRLLDAIGSTLRLNDDTAADPSNSGDAPDRLNTTVYNTGSAWCGRLATDHVYHQCSGCTVDPGSGTWLVKGYAVQNRDGDADGLSGDGGVLLACEETDWGGTVFAAGSGFLSDEEMPWPENFWDDISANQHFLDRLLCIEREQWPLYSIADVRGGTEGQVYRIRGYATSGTVKAGNIFPETVYVQDDTGGIAVVPFTDTGIEIGTPLEVVGYLSSRQGNPVLELIGYEVLDGKYYRYTPKTVLHKTAMNYEANGGRLMQVEGTVTAVTESGGSVSRFTLKDRNGALAEVLIEDGIVSGSTGVNQLANQVIRGKTVRAIGILHLDENGVPVLRVRNCDEVVYVPPVRTPNTGDRVGICLGAMLTAGAALILLLRRRFG